MRPERFELPTYWFEAMNARRISKLALGTRVAIGSPLWLVFKPFGPTEMGTLATVSKPSIQGVGTDLGTGGRFPRTSFACLLKKSGPDPSERLYGAPRNKEPKDGESGNEKVHPKAGRIGSM